MSMKQLNDNQMALLEEFKTSRLSQKEFAETKGISKHSIYYLVAKERKLKAESMSFEVTKPSNFISVSLRPNETTKDKIDDVCFKLNGYAIQIDKSNLKLFLDTLYHD